MRPDELERWLRERLDAPGPAHRAALAPRPLAVRLDHADRIGEFWGYPESRALAELLIDCEEGRTLRAMLVRSWGTSKGSRRGSYLQTSASASFSDVGFRFLLELSDLDRHSECTSDIARS
jgi:hypothetical protein